MIALVRNASFCMLDGHENKSCQHSSIVRKIRMIYVMVFMDKCKDLS